MQTLKMCHGENPVQFAQMPFMWKHSVQSNHVLFLLIDFGDSAKALLIKEAAKYFNKGILC